MELPLMPLHAVLFPGMVMPLFIFEPRYREMIERCLADGDGFGVALIREGKEVGGPAIPWAVGTTANIVRTVELEEGGMHVLTVGADRFRLLDIVQTEPYMVAEVELLAESDEAAVPAEVRDELRELFADHLRLVLQLLGQPDLDIRIPDSASRLSYMVAAHLTCEPRARQRLLEMDSLPQRFFHEKQLLQRESEEYRLLLATRRRLGTGGRKTEDETFSLN
ncbi:MAG TPA: LON peptidase substrate-binding domain-containing protein [Candidatus Cryosericum sp.]|nr:LON peptidase substrate-binding domain-containing protein [Candidatus Cryosericum sp.]